MKDLQEIKDEVAREYGYIDFIDCCQEATDSELSIIVDKIAKAYCEQYLRLATSDLDEEIAGYIHKRDGWKEGTPDYECYDLMVRELINRKLAILSLIPEMK